MKKFLFLPFIILIFLGLTYQANSQYCAANTSNQSQYITDVTFVSINNSNNSWNNTVANFTNLITNVTPGTSYPISVKINGYNFMYKVYVWLDLNNDLNFSTSTEQFILTIQEGGGGLYTGNILIPANATAGAKRMRIRTSIDATLNPCGVSGFGEVEDYSVNVLHSTAPTVQSKNLIFSSVSSTSMKLTWTKGNGDGRLVLIKEGTSNSSNPTNNTAYTANTVYGSGTNIGGAYVVYNGTANNVTITGLNPSTNYTVKVFEWANGGANSIFNITSSTLNPRTKKTAIAPPALVDNLSKGVDYLTAKWTFGGTAESYELCVATDVNFYSMLSDWNNADVGNINEVIVNGLNANTNYYLKVRAIDQYGAVGEWSPSLLVTTLIAPPTSNPSALLITDINFNNAKINWTSTTNSIVLISQSPFSGTLANGSKYVADLNYPSTTSSVVGNAKVVYLTGSKPISLSGLSPNTTYYVAVYNYTGTISTGNVNFGTVSVSGNFTTLTSEPTTAPSAISFSNTTTNSTKVNWTNGNGEKTILLAKAGGGGVGGSLPIGYCTPSFGYDYYGRLNNVSLGSINHSQPGWSSNGYSFQSSLSTNNAVGSTVNFSITHDSPYGYTQYANLLIWVDWNRDGDFIDVGELVTKTTYDLNSPAVIAGNFTVPQTAVAGATRVRVMTAYYYYVNANSPNPCATGSYYYYGEATDYVMNILGGSPADGTSYTANSTFGSGSSLGDWKVVYNGTGNEVNVSGLNPDTQYSFRAYSYNGTNGTENYMSTYAEGSVNTEANTPTVAPSNLTFNTIQGTSTGMAWTKGNGESTLIVASASNSFTAPTKGSTYTVGSSLGSGVVVYNGTGNSGTATGLNPNTTYYYAAYTYNGSGATTNYLNTPAEANMHTLYAEPTVDISSVSMSNITTNSIDFTWTKGNGAYTLVCVYGGTWGTPADAMSYTADSDHTSTSSSSISGSKVVYNGTGNSFTLTGLNPNTSYQVRFFSYNGMGGLENYLVPANVTSNFTTLRKATKLVITHLSVNPLTSGTAFTMTVQAQDANGMPAYNEEDITIEMTKATGNGSFGGTTTTILPSTNHSVTFTNLVYTNNSGETGVAITASDLTTELTPFTYNNINVAPSTPTQDRAILQSSRTQTSMTISWSKGNGNGRIVVASTSALTSVPSDNTSYTASATYGSGATIGNGYVVYNGTGNSCSISGLTPGTTYHFRVFAYNQAGSFIKYNTATASMNPRSLATAARTAVAGNEPAETICDALGTAINIGRIYPSPTINALNFDFTVSESNPIIMSIFDTEGKEVKSISNGSIYSAGTHQFSIDVNELANGVYLLHAIQGECHSIQTFIVNK